MNIPKTIDVINLVEKTYPELSQDEKLRLVCEASIVAFAEICCKSALTRQIPDIHKELYSVLMDEEITRFAAAIPRGMAKSTIISYIFPMWLVLNARTPKLVAIISESAQQAKNFLYRIKEALSTNKYIIDIYGDIGENTAKRWREEDVILSNGSRIIALGTRQKIRGVIQGDTRISVIILDDIESEMNANTVEARVANRKWVTEAVIPSLVQDGTGRLLCIGTIISDDCFLRYCQKASQMEDSNWKVIWKAVLDDDGNSIWEDMMSKKVILAKKAEYEAFGNLAGFYQEYMNMPQSPDDAPFKDHYFKPYNKNIIKENGNWYIKEREYLVPVNMFMGVDLASSLSAKADYTVLLTIAIDPDENIYVVDIDRTKSDPANHPDMICDKYLKYHHSGVQIESVAYQESCRMHVRKLMQEKNLYMPGIERKITQRTSKSERLLNLVPLFAKGKVFIRPGDIEFINEFKAFPRGGHDDIMDAFWLAVRYAKKPAGLLSQKIDTDNNRSIIDGWTL
jgi:predicted phage terminase large subunit-like protein